MFLLEQKFKCCRRVKMLQFGEGTREGECGALAKFCEHFFRFYEPEGLKTPATLLIFPP